MSCFLDLRRLPVPFILSIRGQVDKFTPVLQPFGLPSTVPSPIRLDQHFWMTMGTPHHGAHLALMASVAD